MATIINNPKSESSSSGIIALIIVVIALVLLFVFGLPALRGNTGGTTVNVPDKINVDVTPNGAAQ